MARKCPKCGFIPNPRSGEQNALSHVWYHEASEQLQEYTTEEERAYCKLHFGIPILRNDDEVFREKYDRIVRPLSYEQKLEIMAVPIDFPVTRLMKKKQMREYLDQVEQYFLGRNVQLTLEGRR